jgi:hypothetical protein
MAEIEVKQRYKPEKEQKNTIDCRKANTDDRPVRTDGLVS